MRDETHHMKSHETMEAFMPGQGFLGLVVDTTTPSSPGLPFPWEEDPGGKEEVEVEMEAGPETVESGGGSVAEMVYREIHEEADEPEGSRGTDIEEVVQIGRIENIYGL